MEALVYAGLIQYAKDISKIPSAQSPERIKTLQKVLILWDHTRGLNGGRDEILRALPTRTNTREGSGDSADYYEYRRFCYET